MNSEKAQGCSRKAWQRWWALAVSVAFGLVPGLVVLNWALTDGVGGLTPLETTCGFLSLPGEITMPLPHMGPISFAWIIPVSMLFYYGMAHLFFWLKKQYDESPR